MADIKDTHKQPLHPVQMQILNKIIFKPNARFKDLKVPHLTTDHFTYHLKKLLELNLISKNKNSYNLTEKGKKFVNTMDTELAKEEKFGKRGVLLRYAKPVVQNHKTVLKYLVYKRLKQPFYGYVGFHTGKVRYGESIVDTAFREFKEETGLTIVDYKLQGVYHQLNYKPDGTLLRDVYFYEFFIFKASGKLIKINKEEGVENMWVTKEELKKQKTYPDFWNKDNPTNWQHYPKYFKEYQDLVNKNKWQNLPPKLASLKAKNAITIPCNIYFVERVKILKEW